MKKTFAQRAKELVKKYKRAEFDENEKRELNEALSRLAQEQEDYKSQNNIGNDTNVFQFGTPDITKKSQFNAWSTEPWSFADFQSRQYPYQEVTETPQATEVPQVTETPQRVTVPQRQTPLWNVDAMTGRTADISTPYSYYNNKTGKYVTSGFNDINTKPTLEKVAGYTPDERQQITNAIEEQYNPQGNKSSIIPSLASAAISGIGNLMLARQQKPNEVRLGRVSPEEISLARQRKALEDELRLQGRMAQRNIAGASGSRGQYLTNIGASNAAAQRVYGEQVGNSLQSEELANAQARQQAQQVNAEINAREQLANAQERARSQAAKESYLSAALSSIPYAIRDIREIRNQDKLMNILGQRYKLNREGNIVYTGGK